jgi:hypothetical protein
MSNLTLPYMILTETETQVKPLSKIISIEQNKSKIAT